MSAARKGSPLVRWGRRKVVEVFGADLRSLAVFRVVLAGLVLADLLGRGADLYAHYTDRGSCRAPPFCKRRRTAGRSR